jgi:hypothetical protein
LEAGTNLHVSCWGWQEVHMNFTHRRKKGQLEIRKSLPFYYFFLCENESTFSLLIEKIISFHFIFVYTVLFVPSRAFFTLFTLAKKFAQSFVRCPWAKTPPPPPPPNKDSLQYNWL